MTKNIEQTMAAEDAELMRQIMHANPEIKASIRNLLGIARHEDEAWDTASQAEEKIDKQLKILGKEMLESWGEKMSNRIEKKVKIEQPEYQLKGKKIF